MLNGMSVTKGVGRVDAIVYVNCQFAVLPLNTNTFNASIFDIKLLNEALHDREDRLDKLRIDVEDMKLSKDKPQDEPEGGPEVDEKTRVWYRGSCSLNNEKVVEFNGTFQMEPNDAFKPVKNALEFTNQVSISYRLLMDLGTTEALY